MVVVALVLVLVVVVVVGILVVVLVGLVVVVGVVVIVVVVVFVVALVAAAGPLPLGTLRNSQVLVGFYGGGGLPNQCHLVLLIILGILLVLVW